MKKWIVLSSLIIAVLIIGGIIIQSMGGSFLSTSTLAVPEVEPDQGTTENQNVTQAFDQGPTCRSQHGEEGRLSYDPAKKEFTCTFDSHHVCTFDSSGNAQKATCTFTSQEHPGWPEDLPEGIVKNPPSPTPTPNFPEPSNFIKPF